MTDGGWTGGCGTEGGWTGGGETGEVSGTWEVRPLHILVHVYTCTM